MSLDAHHCNGFPLLAGAAVDDEADGPAAEEGQSYDPYHDACTSIGKKKSLSVQQR